MRVWRQLPAMKRGWVIDGSGSGRSRLRPVRPVGRMDHRDRPCLRRRETAEQPRLLGNADELEARRCADICRTGGIIGATRTIVGIGGALHPGGAVLHRRCGGAGAVVVYMPMLDAHRLTRPLGSARPRSSHRRESDRDRDEHREQIAKPKQERAPPAAQFAGGGREINAIFCVYRPDIALDDGENMKCAGDRDRDHDVCITTAGPARRVGSG